MHTGNDRKAPTKCRNCSGPHRSVSHRCIAQPTHFEIPSKEQLKTSQVAGEREYQAVARAKAADSKALALAENNITPNRKSSEVNITSNQSSEVSINSSQELPADAPSVEEIQL